MNHGSTPAPQERKALHDVITFYSYKGGTGRTMALANMACLLARGRVDGQRILMIDWDLEAPGLHHYFREPNGERILPGPGVVELFTRVSEIAPDAPRADAQDEDKASEALLSTLAIDEFIQPT